MNKIKYKKCAQCGIIQEENSFQKEKHNKDGLRSFCKTCDQLWREANKQKIKENKKQYAIKNQETIAALNKEYYQKNRERIIARVNRYQQSKLQNNPNYKLTQQIKNTIRRALDVNGYTKKSRTYEYLQCSYEEFMEHLGPKPYENCHLDHICPCSQAQNEEELIKLQHYTNFRWLSAKDNLKKSDNKTPEAEEMCKKILKRNWIA